MFKSLKRITYQVGDVAKAREWYCDILGLKPAFDSPFAVIFRVGDCSLSLVQGQPPERQSPERYEIFWDVDDIDAAYKRLIDAGATPHTPVKSILNIRIAKVVDPFGNTLGITSSDWDAKNRTVENHPSESALTVTFCRALASIEPHEEIRGPDHLARLFLKDDAKKALADEASRAWAVRQLSTLYGGLIARTAYIDTLFTEALKDNIPQIVFLGAGYDTRSCRFKDKIKHTRIFEVDAPSTQQRKWAILKESGIVVPDAVTPIPANFKTDVVAEILRKAGYDERGKTLFIWEGVTYYLTLEAVKSTLRFIKEHSARESRVVFDYMTDKHASVYAAEPFLFWMTAEPMKKMLVEYGIDIIEDIGADEKERRFLRLNDGTVAYKSLPDYRILLGVKK
jgi:methyltransferase (TIGR00027 family)